MADEAHDLIAALRFHKHPLTEQAAKRISELEAALREISKMKASPIGDTGFMVGPLSLFQACQRTARKALQNSKR